MSDRSFDALCPLCFAGLPTPSPEQQDDTAVGIPGFNPAEAAGVGSVVPQITEHKQLVLSHGVWVVHRRALDAFGLVVDGLKRGITIDGVISLFVHVNHITRQTDDSAEIGPPLVVIGNDLVISIGAQAIGDAKIAVSHCGVHVIGMDRKDANCSLTNSGWWAQQLKDFAGMGYIETKATTNCALRHQLNLAEGGEYNILVRYCNSNKAGNMRATVNGTAKNVAFEKAGMSDWRMAVIPATLKAGANTLILQNSGSITMIIDQIIYEPAETPKEKFKVLVRPSDFGSVIANVDSAAAGDTVTLTIIPEEGYNLKSMAVVNSIFFTQGKTIAFQKGATTTTFVMPDDNVTIQPAFYDTAAIYELDFSQVGSGALPMGWRTTDGNDVRNYPAQNGSGPRTFTGMTGYQGKALYWRTTSAEYGRLNNYLLTLEPGNYQLVFAMAAWKGTPNYQARILSSSGAAIKTSATLKASPNVNGNYAGDLSPAQRNTLDFEITNKGNYIIQFREVGSGMQEYLIAECRLRYLGNDTAIRDIMANGQSSRINSTYDLNGRKSTNGQLHKGINIVIDADGHTHKVLVK